MSHLPSLALVFNFSKERLRFILPAVVVCTSVLLCVAWAAVDVRFREADGALSRAFCLPLAVGCALMVIGWALPRRLTRFALWLALALLGQAVALQLIDAGPLIHYQHYRLFEG